MGQGVCFSHRGLILWQRFLSSMVSNDNSAFMSILTGDTTLSHGLTRRQGLRDQQSRPLLVMTLSRKGSVDFGTGSRYSFGCNTHHLHCHSRLNKYMVTRARKFLWAGGTRLRTLVVGIPSGFNTIQGAFPDPSTVIYRVRHNVKCHELCWWIQSNKERMNAGLYQTFPKIKKGILPNSFRKTKTTLIPKPKALHKS